LIAIPIYFIVDAGRIVKSDAYPPSDFEKLKNQLLKLIE